MNDLGRGWWWELLVIEALWYLSVINCQNLKRMIVLVYIIVGMTLYEGSSALQKQIMGFSVIFTENWRYLELEVYSSDWIG